MPPSSKIISRQDFPPQLQGLTNMYLAYNIAAGQIRHRLGYLHDAVIGTGRREFDTSKQKKCLSALVIIAISLSNFSF